MKKITSLLLLVTTIVLGQENYPDYQSLWKTVAKFEKKALPKSAFKAVEKIYKKAQKDNNAPQIVKSLIYKSKYTMVLEEDATIGVVNQFKKEIDKATFPAKQILESVLANMYWQYYQNNRWKFKQRTQTTQKVDENDFRTWDLATLFNEIHIHFQNSLKNTEKAQQFPLEKIEALLLTQKDSKIYRPTLFDFLAHNALDFYKTPENSLVQPTDKFEIDAIKYLSDYESFISFDIPENQYFSLQYQALVIYQELLRFHSAKNHIQALVVTDIERLSFVRGNAIFDDKDELYLSALRKLGKLFVRKEVSGLVDFEIATFLSKHHFAKYNHPKYPSSKAESHAICQGVIKKYPASLGAKKCTTLLKNLERKHVQITAENHIPTAKHSKILVSYQNVAQIYFHVYAISQKEIQQYRNLYRKPKKIKFIEKLKKVTSFKRALINKEDYLTHTTELLLPPMQAGQYMVVVTDAPQVRISTVDANYLVQATNIALSEYSTNKVSGYQLFDRITGNPITNATVEIKNEPNGYYNFLIDKILVSDINGKVEFKKEKNHNNVIVKVTYGNEVAYFGDYSIDRLFNDSRKKIHDYTSVFTDRSIYRPGQIVYFKGVVYEKNQLNRYSHVIPNRKVTVKLLDVHYKKVSELELESNDYGSFTGNFVLPAKGLTGQYHIEIVGSKYKNLMCSTFFSVEEYKRPKFEVLFNPITKTYKLNDSITALGTATAYAGSAISKAKVVYTVKRQVQYPRWCYWYYPTINASEQEIANGTTVTDAQGNFKIQFKAVPNKSVAKETQPIFSYEVSAAITDVNGETRTVETIVRVGYQAMTLQMEVEDEVAKQQGISYKIIAKNLNDVSIKNKGKIRIYKLQAPKRVLNKRLWNYPDISSISEEEYVKYFPHSPYKDEDDYLKWKNGTLVWKGKYQSEQIMTISSKEMQSWEAGKYKVEVTTKDRFGNEVIDREIITINNNAATKVADKALFTISMHKKSYKLGEHVVVKLGTAVKNLLVTLDVERQGEIKETKQIVLQDEIQTISFPMLSSDTDGFAIHYNYVFNNHFYAGKLLVPIEDVKREFEIETVTFRDKLKPGEQEKWSFKIKNKGDKDMAAEFLASMYDASLDQFRLHKWNFEMPTFGKYNAKYQIDEAKSFGANNATLWKYNRYYSYPTLQFDRLNWFNFYFGNPYRMYYKNRLQKRGNHQIQIVEEYDAVEETIMSSSEPLSEVVVTGAKNLEKDKTFGGVNAKEKQKNDFSGVTIRKNFNETAFFYPQLRTDKEGAISFEFTTPEALTQWKLQLLAHTKKMSIAQKAMTVKTQKELMVIPNAPRFLREGDKVVFSTKIANISEKPLSGVANLVVTDPFTGKNIDVLFKNKQAAKEFTVDAKENTFVTWELQVPKHIQAVQYKVVAKAGDFSDGEQNVLPIVTNRMLVTETMPLWVSSNEERTFVLDKLKKQKSFTLQHQKLTVEITSNPAWYALQSLPYLMEATNESNEQLFARLYANALASHIVNSQPAIKKVFDRWEQSDVLLSNLEKNQELKSVLIEETPWLRDAENETEQKKRIALLFNLNTMKYELASVLQKLATHQYGDGSWAWFDGGCSSRQITQHIVAGLGHLKHLGVTTNSEEIIRKALYYLDQQFVKEYKEITKYKEVDLDKNHLSSSQIHYMYLRSFFTVPMTKEVKEIHTYYMSQMKKYWTKTSLYNQALVSLVSHRSGESTLPSSILKSLKERSVYNEELGMYWKSNVAGYYYYQAPIETQSLLIEAFTEIENDTKTVDKLKMWLLKHKQTNRWKTSKATTEAVYALLLQGSDWLTNSNSVTLMVGDERVVPSQAYQSSAEAGTGYYKTSWNKDNITPKKATVTIAKQGKGMAWGGVYWQYFEDLDKITSAKTPLQITKELFLKNDTAAGKQLTKITSDKTINVGDLVTVRIEIKVDRTMEFVHLKDMRASGLEPISVLSSYKWQDGLGYYQSTKDVATHFYFDIVPKGVYVFEYDLRVNNSGDFSNGITTIQSMYAPEFSSHSKGVRLNVK